MTTETPVNPDRRRSFSVRFSDWLSRVLVRLKVDDVPHIKRIIVTVVGGTILVLGVLMFFTPGPAILVIPAGLAVLGTEYAWARRWLRNARKMAKKALSQTQRIFSSTGAADPPDAPAAKESAPACHDPVESGKLPS